MLTIDILSFGFQRSGIPADPHGHGGGFVFDARCLPNPGRQPQYRDGNGLDPEVGAFLEAQPETAVFLSHAIALIDQAARTYGDRGFAHLQVCFGCTGGQHRSVFCAESVAQQLRRLGFHCLVRHTEQEYWP